MGRKKKLLALLAVPVLSVAACCVVLAVAEIASWSRVRVGLKNEASSDLANVVLRVGETEIKYYKLAVGETRGTSIKVADTVSWKAQYDCRGVRYCIDNGAVDNGETIALRFVGDGGMYYLNDMGQSSNATVVK